MKLMHISLGTVSTSLTYNKTGKATYADGIMDQIFELAFLIKLARIKYSESSNGRNYSLTEFTKRMENIFNENL